MEHWLAELNKLIAVDQWIGQRLLGQETWRYLLAFTVMLSTLVLKKIFDKVIAVRLGRWAARSRFRHDDLLISSLVPPASALLFSTGLFLSLFMFRLPREPYNLPLIISQGFHVTLVMIAVWAVYRLVDLLAELIRSVFFSQEPAMADHFTPLVRQALRITVVIMGGIMIVQNMGYSVTSLMAGLGVAGLAIGLAAQDTIANIFGTFVMFTDKPFRVGEWIKFGEVDGHVEEIGFRSTTVRTFANTVLHVPNKLITSEIIENCTSMRKRQVKFTIGVQYDSPPEKLEELVAEIRRILEQDPGVHQEYKLVRFIDFSASSLDILIHYFTSSTVWSEHLEVRERVNLALMRLVRRLDLSFAFPSQTIYFGGAVTVDRPAAGPAPDDGADGESGRSENLRRGSDALRGRAMERDR